MGAGHPEDFGVSVAGPEADITEDHHASIIPNYPSWRNRPAAVPEIMRVSGDQAVATYLAFFDQPKWRPSTRKLYGQHARRFFRWSAERALTLESIATTDVAAYSEEVAGAKSPHEASVYLTPVRGLFRRFMGSGVVFDNPFGKADSGGRQPADSGFPKPRIPRVDLKRDVLEIGK